MSTPASFFNASPFAAASKGIDFAPPIDSQGRTPPKGINVAGLFLPNGCRGVGCPCSRCSFTGRAAAEGVDFAAGLLPDSGEKQPQLLEEACKPAAVPPGCRGRALRGRGYRRHQSQTQTHQNNEAPKRPHTHSFAEERPGRAFTDCAAAPQEVWCPGEVWIALAASNSASLDLDSDHSPFARGEDYHLAVHLRHGSRQRRPLSPKGGVVAAEH